MPVIVVGADTQIGSAVISALSGRAGELRAFVSDPQAAAELRSRGVKVAMGDVSDGSHVGGAALHCFSVVLISSAATDERERAFATRPDEVFAAWLEAIEMAQPQRVLWVDHPGPRPPLPMDHAFVESGGRTIEDVAAEIGRLDDLASLP